MPLSCCFLRRVQPGQRGLARAAQVGPELGGLLPVAVDLVLVGLGQLVGSVDVLQQLHVSRVGYAGMCHDRRGPGRPHPVRPGRSCEVARALTSSAAL